MTRHRRTGTACRARTKRERVLEGEFQGHLDLAGAADGFVDDADAAQRWRRIELGAVDGEIVEIKVLSDVVDGNIEAGGVGEVEDFEGEP
jgi:hypothetical protein